MKTKLITRLATTVLALGALSSCGGSSDVEPEADASDTTTTESEAPEDSGDDAVTFCAAFIKLDSTGEKAITFEETVGEVQTLTETAPTEVTAEVETVAESFTALVDAVASEGLDVSVLDDLESLPDDQRNALETAAVANGYDPEATQKAAGTIEAWATENCEDYNPGESPETP